MRLQPAVTVRLPGRVLTALVLVGWGAGLVPVSGNGMRLASQDAFASARGEAFVATADTPAAVHYNPAGLLRVDAAQLRSGIYTVDYKVRYTAPDGAPNAGSEYDTRDDFAVAPQLFYSQQHPSERWAVGVGVYAPYGAGLEWPEDTGFRSVALAGQLRYLRLSPAVAVAVGPRLKVGAGLTADYADLSLEQGLLRFEQPFTNRFKFEGDGWSFGWQAGLLWEPTDTLSVGAVFRSANRMTFKGETDLVQQPILPPSQRSAEATFDFPWSAALGIAWRPTAAWNFEINADYTDWGTLNDVTIRQTPAPPFPVRQNIPVNLHWEGSWLWSAGVTRHFRSSWHASAGYAFNQNSVPDRFYTPLAADLDRHFFTVGTGWRNERWRVDAALQVGYGPKHTVRGSLPSSQPGLFSGQNADGDYRFSSVAAFLSLGRQF